MNNKLEILITESGLEKTKAESLKTTFSDFFDIASEWERKANEIVVTNETHTEQMKLAREGRLFLKDKRVFIEKTRKNLKDSSLKEGRAIDEIAKYLTNLIEPIEKNLQDKEDFVKNLEQERKIKLSSQRLELLKEFMEFVPMNLDFGSMIDSEFEMLFNGAKLQFEQKQAQIERERIENIKRQEKQQLYNVRKNAFIPYWGFMSEEERLIDFSELTDSNYDYLIDSLQQKKKEYDEERIELALANERLLEEKRLMQQKFDAENNRIKEAERKLKELEEAKKRETDVKKTSKNNFESDLHKNFMKEFTENGVIKPCNPDAIFNWFANNTWRKNNDLNK